MGHFVAPDGSTYVDTDFVNRVQRLPGVSVEHMGFGEFYVQTPKGRVEVDRMRGKPFEGQSGRSHKFYDDKGGTDAANWVVDQMETHNMSDRASEKLATTAGRVAARFLQAAESRSLSDIARDIRKDWKQVNFGAKPYLEAMGELDKITDTYGADPARNIVNYFLSNASSWRGPKAKEIKDELKAILKSKSASESKEAGSVYQKLIQENVRGLTPVRLRP
jgi:hypothetical protein